MIGHRIRRARISHAFSMEKLAAQSGVTKQSISKYESGRSMPSSDVLLRLAKALDVKVEYFFRPVAVKLENVSFRRRARLSVTERKKIEETAKDRLERYLMLEEVFPEKDKVLDPLAPLDIHINRPADAESAAIELRNAWNLGLDPIEDVTELLEAHEIKIVEVESSDKFDGLSGYIDQQHAFITIGRAWPGERQRFTLAHELGHLVLNISPACEAKTRERCCQRFAAAFLAPEPAVLRELGEFRRRITWPEWLMLKEKYGLSMAAWIYRARDLEVITRSHFEQLYRQLGARGWRRQEPCPLGAEEPTRFKRLLLRALSENLISESKAGDILAIKTSDLWKKIWEWAPEVSPV